VFSVLFVVGMVASTVLVILVQREKISLSWHRVALLSQVAALVFPGCAFASIYLCVTASRKHQANNWPKLSKWLIYGCSLVEVLLLIVAMGLLYSTLSNCSSSFDSNYISYQCYGGDFLVRTKNKELLFLCF
jgi:hypothetical protein